MRWNWLLLVAVVGCSKPATVTFVDVTAVSGVAFTHTTGATGKKLLPETMGAGVGVLDFDSDGYNRRIMACFLEPRW